MGAQAPPPGSGPIDFNGFVRVIDGDTFEVYIQGHRTGVGIIGIETAMGNTPCGVQATDLLWSLVASGRIRLEEDPEETAFDARKRRMYRVVLDDGRSAAVVMAESGFVVPTGKGIERNDIQAATGRLRSPQANSCAEEIRAKGRNR